MAPEAIITDTGSYSDSDIVFGLLGRQYRPQLADLPDQRLWRLDPAADYSPLAGRDRPLHWVISRISHIRPIFDIEGVLDPSPGSTRPIRPGERSGVGGFTDEKSSATSSVLVALSYRWKD